MGRRRRGLRSVASKARKKRRDEQALESPFMGKLSQLPAVRGAEVFCDGFVRDADGNAVAHDRYEGRKRCPVCSRRAAKETERIDLDVGPYIDEYMFPNSWPKSGHDL